MTREAAARARAGKAAKQHHYQPVTDANRRRKPRKIAPFSQGLSFAGLDLRTKEGQYCHGIKTALFEQLGGNPTPAQQVLVQLSAIKALRCEMLLRVILTGEPLKDSRENYILAWMNGLRRDLEALGLLAPPVLDHRLPPQTIHEIMART